MVNTSGRAFFVFPAIDMRGGRVVRLQEGDPARQTTYDADPVNAALRWMDGGASWLHIVNLDGAFSAADNANQAALGRILQETQRRGVSVQFGGGLRQTADVDRAIGLGVTRCMIGTLAVEAPQVLGELVARHGNERIGASLDCRGGMVALRGWAADSSISASEVAQTLRGEGVECLVYTDIARDGLQTGINLAETAALARASGMRVIASGGVRSAGDVRDARNAGLAGIIVGKALYEGSVTISDVLAAARGENQGC